MFPFMQTDKGVTVFVDGRPVVFHASHSHYAELIQAIDDDDDGRVRELVDVRNTVTRMSFGRIQILENTVLVDDRPMTGRLIERILDLARRGSKAINGYVAFLDRLMDNPSKRAVDELYGFVEACDLPVTEDGHLLAYRFVGEDYMDSFSSTVLNKPAVSMTDAELELFSTPQVGGREGEVTIQVVNGQTVISCPRNAVDEDKNRTCSAGLHFCSYGYLPSYGVRTGYRVIVVKIDPADVVAIPADHQNQKGRTCRYTIVDEIEDWSDLQLPRYFSDESYEPDDFEDDEDMDWLDEEDEYVDDLLDDELPEFDDLGLYDEPVQGERYDVDEYASSTAQKLSAEDVREIRDLLSETDLTMTEIARQFGVHRRTIGRIRDGEIWRDV